MGFTLTQPQESCEINGHKFTVDPFEEFDAITTLETDNHGDITLRDAAYRKRMQARFGLPSVTEIAVQAFINWIIGYCQDFLESDKKKLSEPPA
jgi:hypothetical protein